MPDLVSVHGGHSGEFCGHAVDTLAEVVAAYVDAGFRWVCLTEHMAPHRQTLVAEDEAPLDVAGLQRRFGRYFAEARRLQAKWAEQIDILVGFETEAFSGYRPLVQAAMDEFAPDMIVGSVHHVGDIPFDCSERHYRQAVAEAGGLVEFYCAYFDLQLEIIDALRPAVVGHFDLVRIYDADYAQRWRVPAIHDRAVRNLHRIAALDLMLDINVRALAKGQSEPYVSAPWLALAVELGIDAAPGDDSHGVATVGLNVGQAIDWLQAAGANTAWRRPGTSHLAVAP